MKHTVFEVIQIACGVLLIFRKSSLPKPIHVIAMSFFTLLVMYATSSLLPIICECAVIIKSHMNLDAIPF